MRSLPVVDIKWLLVTELKQEKTTKKAGKVMFICLKYDDILYDSFYPKPREDQAIYSAEYAR